METDQIRKMSIRDYCGALEIPKQEHYVILLCNLVKELTAQISELKHIINNKPL